MEYPLLPRFADSIVVKVFPSGQRRTIKDPPASLLRTAFDELGTNVAVARAFGVTRRVVKRWTEDCGLGVVSRPEVRYANSVRARLSIGEDQEKVAQWLMDEGSVSVAYFGPTDSTILLVCGGMNDFDVLSQIGRVLGVPITSSRLPSLTTLPMGAVRVQGPRAYALLQALVPRLLGLKELEAREAMRFFPPSGKVKGRHTTDEFLSNVWLEHARKSLFEWNSRRRVKLGSEELEARAKAWVEGRIRRARRFLNPPNQLHDGKGDRRANSRRYCRQFILFSRCYLPRPQRCSSRSCPVSPRL